MNRLSPWVSIWLRPRQTIEGVVDKDPRQGLWPLAFLFGFTWLLNLFQSLGMGSYLGLVPMLLVALVLAPLWGQCLFNLYAAFVFWVGKLFKGKASFAEVRAAYAWSCVPFLIEIPLWLLLWAMYGDVLFVKVAHRTVVSTGEAVFFFLLMLGKLAMGIWALVIYFQTLSQVQRFSMLRALGNILLAGGAVLLLLTFILSLVFHPTGVMA